MLFLVVRRPAVKSVVDFVIIEIFHKKLGNHVVIYIYMNIMPSVYYFFPLNCTLSDVLTSYKISIKIR